MQLFRGSAFILLLIFRVSIALGDGIHWDLVPPTTHYVAASAQGSADTGARVAELQSQVNSLEETVAKYADAFDKLEERLSKLDKPEATDSGQTVTRADLDSLTQDFEKYAGDATIVHSGSSASTMEISGRIHMDYWGFPNNDPEIDLLEDNSGAGPQARLGFRRLRIGVEGTLPSNMLYKIEMEFAGGNASEFRDAFIGWTDIPLFQEVLVGNQKRPYGLDHLNSSRYNVFLERPFVIEAFNQDSRRFGIQSYRVSEDQAWNTRLGVFNQQLIQSVGNHVNDNLQLEVAGRLANTFWYDEVSNGRGYGHWAVSYSYASPDGGDTIGTNEARFRHRPEARNATRWLDTGAIDGANNYQLWGLEGVLNFGALQLVSEAQYVRLDRDGNASDLEFGGWYCYASYFLTSEYMPWSRSRGVLDRIKPFENFFLVDTRDDGVQAGWGAWQVAARYSYADFNNNDINGGIGESLTLGLNWYWTPNSRMQFDYIQGRIEDANEDLGTSLSGSYDIVGARFSVDF